MANKMKSFVKEVLARIEGDEAKTVAERNYRKAASAVDGQIAALNSKKIDAEVEVEEAEEALMAAIYPTELISDNQKYIQGIHDAQSRVDQAKEDLEDIQFSIEYMEATKDRINA